MAVMPEGFGDGVHGVNVPGRKALAGDGDPGRRGADGFAPGGPRQIAVVTEAPDHSPAGLRSVYTMLGTYLAGRTDPDESTLTSGMASFELIR
ncbi:hypothetical protein [Micromonospora sp. NPDC001898]|uniref:hypothetical protein n=1 Tax=Micromonospora sp. NPDC001898 TaxID=3364221 RepID=UPI0036AF8599